MMVLDENGMVIDVMPGSLPDEEKELYTAYPLRSTFPSLLCPPSSVEIIAREAALAFHARQLSRLPASARTELIEAVVASQSSARIDMMAQFLGSDDRAMLGDAKPPVVQIGLERHGDEITVVSSSVSRLPVDRLPSTTAAFRCPPTQTRLDTFLEACRSAFVEPWRRRKLLAEEFQRLYAVIELDDYDFSRLQILIQIRAEIDNKKRLCIIDFGFGSDFPAKPPKISVRDYRGEVSLKHQGRSVLS